MDSQGESGRSPVQQGEQTARGSTLLVSNLLKLVGAAVFVNEAVLTGRGRTSVLAVCALFVLGTQVAENALMRAIDRIFDQRA